MQKHSNVKRKMIHFLLLLIYMFSSKLIACILKMNQIAIFNCVILSISFGYFKELSSNYIDIRFNSPPFTIVSITFPIYLCIQSICLLYIEFHLTAEAIRSTESKIKDIYIFLTIQYRKQSEKSSPYLCVISSATFL